MNSSQPLIQQTIQTPVPIITPQPKTNWILITLSVFSTILLVAIVFLSLQNQKLQKQITNPPVSPTIQALIPTPKTVSSISIPPDETAGWKIFQNEYFTIRYPNNWSFEKYNQNLYKGHTLFQDLDSNLKVSGEIKIVTPQQIKGRVWPDFSIENFFDPKNNFWEVGENIGGGPGFSYQTPFKVLIAGYNSMFQSTHPSKSGYEGSSTDYITNYYYIPINNSTKEIVEININFYRKLVKDDQSLIIFNQILSTFRFTN